MKKKLLLILLCFYCCVNAQLDSLVRNPVELFDDVFKVYKEEKYRKAIQLSEEFLTNYPENEQYPYILVIQINSFYQLGEFEEAIFKIKEFEADYKDHSSLNSVLFLKGLIYKEEFQYGKASKTFLRIHLLNHDDKYLKEKNSAELVELIENKLNIEELKTLLNAEGREKFSELINYRLAYLLYERKNYEESLVFWKNLLPSPEYGEDQEVKKYIEACEEFTKIKNSLGVIGPMSGKYSAYGEDLLRAASIAVNLYNNDHMEKIKIVSLDNKNNPIETVKILKKSINEKNLLGIIGPVRATNSIAAGIIANQFQVPIVSPTVVVNRYADLGEGVFQLSSPNYIIGEKIAEYAISEENMKHFIVCAPASQYGKNISASFIELAEKLGGKIIDSVYYQEDQTDFRTLFKRIKNNIETDSNYMGLIDSILIEEEYKTVYKVDGIFIPASTIDQVLLIIPQFASELIMGRFIGNRIWLNKGISSMDHNLIQNSLIGSDQAYSFDKRNNPPEQDLFFQEYYKKYDVEPGMIALKCYDATRLILKAFEEGARYPQAIINNLRMIENYPGLTGSIHLNRYNGANSSCFFYEIRNGVIYRKR